MRLTRRSSRRWGGPSRAFRSRLAWRYLGYWRDVFSNSRADPIPVCSSWHCCEDLRTNLPFGIGCSWCPWFQWHILCQLYNALVTLSGCTHGIQGDSAFLTWAAIGDERFQTTLRFGPLATILTFRVGLECMLLPSKVFRCTIFGDQLIVALSELDFRTSNFKCPVAYKRNVTTKMENCS